MGKDSLSLTCTAILWQVVLALNESSMRWSRPVSVRPETRDLSDDVAAPIDKGKIVERRA